MRFYRDLLLASLSLLAAMVLPTAAQTGSLLAGPLSVQIVPNLNGRGIAFDGVNLYVTNIGSSDIFKLLPPLTAPPPPVTISVPAGDPRVSAAGPLAWDGSALWTVDYSGALILYRVDPTNGATLFSCSIPAANPGHPALPGLDYPDGLHWTGIPGSELVVSGEVDNPTAVAFVDAATCAIASFFVVPFSPTSSCCSGVAFDGAYLWHSRPGDKSVFETDLAGVPTGVSFATPQLAAPFEDLEYDPITFAPTCALWGMTSGSPIVGPPHIAAYEIPCPPPSTTTSTSTTSTTTSTNTTTSTLPPVCAAAPLAGCRTAGQSYLKLRDVTPNSRTLGWKWKSGPLTTFADLGNPVSGTTSYALCVYDESAGVPSLAFSARGPAGAHWEMVGGICSWYKYTDFALLPDGIEAIRLHLNCGNLARFLVKGRGAHLPLPGPALAGQYLRQNPQVIAQLVKSDGGVCWEARYTPPASLNSATHFTDQF